MWEADRYDVPMASCRCRPPATELLLRDIPSYGGSVWGELCRTDFADIQIKKNVEVTDNGKDDF